MSTTDFRDLLIGRSRRLAARARNYFDASVAYARESSEQLAQVLDDLDAPVRTLQVAGTRLTVLSQRYAEELLAVQAAAVEAALEDGATRLRMVARADDLRTLLREQVERLPASRERMSVDLREAAAATSKVGRELRGLASDTYSRLLEGKAPRKPATVKRGSRPAVAARGRGGKARAAKRRSTKTPQARTSKARATNKRAARKTA